MHTVVLASKQKHEILNDINEYLHPATPKWYASRGIPLRRGYLFHGPPGTGKTSFSFALAGVFGIDIYVISLQDANVTEEEIALLFTKLPRRCIILLEDIDTAGLKRDVVEEEDKRKPIDKGEKKDEIPAAENGIEEKKHKRHGGKAETEMNGSRKESNSSEKKRQGKAETSSSSEESENSGVGSDGDERERKKRRQRKRRLGRGRVAKGGGKVVSVENISLSGLLNAIDGVASHEGRILIMTTNKPESLDEALIRPGRVDLQVAFTNATSQQAGELFRRMYEIETEDPLSEEKMTIRMEPELTSEEIGEIADDFAAKIPEEVFSPAEIQGFLLKRKKTPRKALEDAPAWIEATQKQKEAKSKILTVQ
jgi:chaperone BCS1